MADFRIQQSSTNETVTFGSTNRWLRFALAWWETQAFPGRVGREDLSQAEEDHRRPAALTEPHIVLRRSCRSTWHRGPSDRPFIHSNAGPGGGLRGIYRFCLALPFVWHWVTCTLGANAPLRRREDGRDAEPYESARTPEVWRGGRHAPRHGGYPGSHPRRHPRLASRRCGLTGL